MTIQINPHLISQTLMFEAQTSLLLLESNDETYLKAIFVIISTI